MNEDGVLYDEPLVSDPSECDSVSQENAVDECGGEEAVPAANGKETLEDPALPADPMPVAHSDHGAPAAESAAGDVDELRGELIRLQEELALRDRRMSRMGEELAEFAQLYPEISMGDVSDSVWESVKQGVPLSAAYAVEERRKLQTAQRAGQSNLRNRQRTSGELASAENDIFSPAEVRAMSREEVRANYSKIMRSMQKWH
jgi:hypothetical protein